MQQNNNSARDRITKYAKIGTALAVAAALFLSFNFNTAVLASDARPVSSPFLYNFNSDGVLNETGNMNDSSSPYFWLNSGGMMLMKNGIGSTIEGALPTGQFWQVLYGKNNPLDTGNGYYPQNLFRLVTRSTWHNVQSEVAFKIDKVNLTDTPNRDGYSGILMMSRYTGDGQTLYYAGLRQDGTAVIKKKLNGIYYTVAQAKVFPGVYDKTTNSNLIPANQWMKLRTTVQDQADGSVLINVYLDQNNNGSWVKVLSGSDVPGKFSGTPVISGSYYAGIRTDYMDVQFDNYRLTEL